MLCTCIASLAVKTMYAQPGSLDLSFGTDGIAITDFSGSGDYAYAMAIQDDGKIVLAGYAYAGSTNDFALARYNANGTLDNTFDSDGKVMTDFNGGNIEVINAIVIQPDGKIVAAGNSWDGNETHFALARYNIDGSLDNSFSSDGMGIYNWGTNDYGTAVALQSDGKILIAGASYLDGYGYHVSALRINTDGTVDNTFDSGGVSTVVGEESQVNAMILQSDGKIVMAGRRVSNLNSDFLLLRYTANGSIDNTFDTDGIVTTAFGSGDDYAFTCIQQSDGKLLAGGSSANGFNDFALARYNSNGSLDNTFSADGKVTTDIASGSDDYGYSVKVQSDGKILLGGYSEALLNDFSVVRYNANGSLENLFDLDGKVTTDLRGTYDYAHTIALQSDGKIVVAGHSDSNTDSYDFAVVRYNAVCSFVGSTQNITLTEGQTLTVGTHTYTTADGSGTYQDILTAASGCDSVVTTNLTVLTAINEFSGSEIISVAPNPFMNELIINGTEAGNELFVFDVTGKLMLTANTTATQTRVGTDLLSPGIYMLGYRDRTKAATVKVVKF